MAENQTAADRLYGATPAAPAAPEQTAAPEQAIADRMYAPPPGAEARTDTPTEITAIRAADPARRMYPAGKAFAQDLPEGSLPGIDVFEARECAADLGAEAADLRELRTLANAQAEPDIDAWRVESHQMLAQRGYTPADLDAARQLARRDPRVLDYLNATGLGDHPKVVERFIVLARQARANGTLPRGK